ncbi:MAG: FxDxF family PEP-CTERM protein [Thiobacillus sp.]
MIIGLAMTGSSYAAVNSLQLTDTFELGAFGAPTNYADGFSVGSAGAINHSLTFTILTNLYAGSGVSDIPLSLTIGQTTTEFFNIDGLTAEIFDSLNNSYASFVSAGDADHLTLPANSYFAAGNYTLKIGGTATGSNGGLYTVAAVTTPVPEPETWGMLLAGIGLIGLRMRQRIRARGHVAIN